jgi:hypothetical protein
MAMLATQTVFCGALAVVAPTGRTRPFALVLVAAGLAAAVRPYTSKLCCMPNPAIDDENSSALGSPAARMPLGSFRVPFVPTRATYTSD